MNRESEEMAKETVVPSVRYLYLLYSILFLDTVSTTEVPMRRIGCGKSLMLVIS